MSYLSTESHGDNFDEKDATVAEKLSLKNAIDRVKLGENVHCMIVAMVPYIYDYEISYNSCGICQPELHDGICTEHGKDCGVPRSLYKLYITLEQDGFEIEALAFDNIGNKLFGMNASDFVSLMYSNTEKYNKAFYDLIDKEYTLRLSFFTNQNQIQCIIEDMKN